jgi:hypothetical protein
MPVKTAKNSPIPAISRSHPSFDMLFSPQGYSHTVRGAATAPAPRRSISACPETFKRWNARPIRVQ